MRGATRDYLPAYLQHVTFQFTHPVRGATRVHTHCPTFAISFNSRTPCGVRQPAFIRWFWDHLFQFTHPVRGATQYVENARYIQDSFNSRTPCGVRQALVPLCLEVLCFNSRTPCGVRHDNSMNPAVISGFNSRTPCGVRHRKCALYTRPKGSFQFTHPVRGATRQSWIFLLYCGVSIHAPRAGCDCDAQRYA